MAPMRTEEGENRYREYRKNKNDGCALCNEKETLRGFKFWKIVENTFPYDNIAKIHHMIVPIRHVPEDGLTEEEFKELKEIKDAVLHTEYEYIIEATFRRKSIPEHFHLHLIEAK